MFFKNAAPGAPSTPGRCHSLRHERGSHSDTQDLRSAGFSRLLAYVREPPSSARYRSRSMHTWVPWWLISLSSKATTR